MKHLLAERVKYFTVREEQDKYVPHLLGLASCFPMKPSSYRQQPDETKFIL